MGRKKRSPAQHRGGGASGAEVASRPAAPAAPRVAPSAAQEVRRAPRLRVWVPLGTVATAALAWLAALLFEADSRGAPVEVPDPTSPEMLAPVARAIAQARTAVLSRPSSAAAWGALGEVCDAHHLYDEAGRCYQEARRLDPREFRWVYHLAVVSDYQAASADEVAGLFAEAIRLQPSFPPARLRQGDAFVRQGRLEDARASFSAALELDPAFAMAHRNLGQVLLSLEDVPGALEHLERAAALAPSDAVVSSSLARAYWLAGDEERAERAGEDAARQVPEYGIPDPVRYAVDELALTPAACDRRARERLQRGEWARALADLEILREVSGESPAIELRLATCQRNLGAPERAREHLERALELDPASVEALGELGLLAEAEGHPERAVERYRRALELAPERARLHARLGACLGFLGDLEGAVSAFERSAALERPGAELEHNWGTALDRLGRPEEACTHFRAALALEPANAGTHFNLALSLETLGMREEALAHHEKAAALDPSLPAAARLAELRKQP